MPSAVTRAEALEALLPSLTRRISSALAKSPSALVRAFLHSIMGASVLARSSATMLAVIAAISFLRLVGVRRDRRHTKILLKKGADPQPLLVKSRSLKRLR